ncbi:MAG: class I SAM-dependent methyltransferase [Bacillota bacterium]
MRSLKRLLGYVKIGLLYAANRVVDKEDFQQEYNEVSKTYNLWSERMGKHTDNILKPEYLEQSGKTIQILDFACGRGYITSKLLRDTDGKIRITGLDISPGMLDCCKANIDDDRAEFILADGLEYLKKTENKYDAVYCGWGLCYLSYKKVLRLFHRVLNKNGIAGVIVNSKGTLQDIEQIYVDAMCDNPLYIDKVMDIKFNLPKDRQELEGWFAKYGFEAVYTGEGEELVYFDTPEELYRWLRNTGAAAGMGKIFNHNEAMEKEIIKRIKEKRYINGKYMINHKFAYGVFRKGEN